MLPVNNIYCGDCIELLKEIPDNTVDLILTSPPYNVGTRYDNYNDSMNFDDYWQWCRKWLKEFYRILKPDGRCAVVHYLSFGNREHKCSPIAMLDNIQREIGFKHHAIVVWEDETLHKLTAWGSWLSASAPYINTPYEGILITYKEQWKKQRQGRSTITKEEFIEYCRGAWKIPPASSTEHPAVFPEELAHRVINLLTFEEDLVVDPFCGTGTTLVVAKKLNRRYIGMDISEKYVNIAKKRIEKTVINLNLFSLPQKEEFPETSDTV